MINIERTKDPKVVLSFLKGEGIRRLCSGHSDGSPSEDDIRSIIENDKNHIMLVLDDSNRVGWVAFFALDDLSYMIHVCLKTVGRKTREAIALGIKYIKIVEKGHRIYAVYPSARAAVSYLTRFFNFIEDKEALAFLAYPCTKQLVCERLDLI